MVSVNWLVALLLAYLFYRGWNLLVQTRAVQLAKGFAAMVAVYVAAFAAYLLGALHTPCAGRARGVGRNSRRLPGIPPV
jgi:DNA integrity scanning protein DisA with diadenylate cyclase activity